MTDEELKNRFDSLRVQGTKTNKKRTEEDLLARFNYLQSQGSQQPTQTVTTQPVQQVTTQYGAGNIDLTKRPVVKNDDGSISTVRSMSFNEDGKEILVPTVVNGRVVSDQEAIDHYHKTGEYLGKFNTVDEANAYAENLHNQQEKLYGHSVKAQQGMQQAQDRLHTAEQKSTPMTDKINSGATLTPEETIQLALEQGRISKDEAQYQLNRLKAKNQPYANTSYFNQDTRKFDGYTTSSGSKYSTTNQASNEATKAIIEANKEKTKKNPALTQEEKAQGKKDAAKTIQEINSANSADYYSTGKEKYEQAKANDDVRGMTEAANIVQAAKKEYKKEHSEDYSNINIPRVREQLAGLYTDLVKAEADYNNATDPVAKNLYAQQFNSTLQAYKDKQKTLNEAVAYDEIINNNIVKDTAQSGWLGYLGGVGKVENGAYALGSRLAGADAATIDANELLKFNNKSANLGDNLKDVAALASLGNPMNLPLNLVGGIQGSNAAYTKLAMIAAANPNNIGLQRLFKDITNHTYEGTAKDLQNELDRIQKELYQNFKDYSGTYNTIEQEKQQLQHNQIYGNLAAIPNAVNTVTNMAASQLLAPVGGEVASMTALGLGAGSQGLDEALQSGASYNQGFNYGALTGLTEIGTEKMFESGINRALGIRGAVDPSQWTKGIIDTFDIKNRLGRVVLNTLGDTAGEATEEMVSEALNPLWKTITYDKDAYKDFDFKQVIQAGIDAIPSTLIMEGMGLGMQAVKANQIEQGIIKSINNTDLSQIVKKQLINEVREASKDVKLGLEENEYMTDKAWEKYANVSALSEQMKQRIPEGYSLPQSTIDILAYTENNRPGLNIAFDTNIQGNGTFVENPDGTRTITLNPNSKRAVEFTLTHELGHDLKGTGEYTQLQNLLTDYAKGKPGYQNALNQLDKTYKESGANYNLQDEATNDMLGQAIGEQEFYNKLAENPTLFNRVTNSIKNILGNKESKLKTKVENLTKKALQQEYKGKQEGTQQSISDVTDSQGRELSEGQQTYFKDSKVRDSEGRLLEVYHGTNSQFNKYNIEKFGQTDRGMYGKGFYFTDQKDQAKYYGNRVKKQYLKIDNPLYIGRGTKYQTPSDYVRDIRGEKYDQATLLSQLQDGTYKSISAEEITNVVKENGYDGIIVKPISGAENEYIVFEPNQIKNVDNTAPTDNPDIRYQKQNQSWQQFLDNTYGKWNTGTRTNFEGLPSNEELQQAENKGVNAILKDLKIPTNEELQQVERASVENDAKALNMVSEEEYLKAPKNTIDGDQFDYAEHDKKLQQQIEKQVLDAIGNDFNRDTLLKRLQEASEIADKKRNIDTITNADEDQVTVNHRVRTILDDFIRDIKQGYDIRDSLVYKMFTDKSYNIPDTGKKEYEQPPNKISANRPLDELRNFKKVGDRKVNAYQYDNPEVKPFFQHEARNMLQDLNNVIKGERTATWDDYGTLRYTGTTREATQDIIDLLDGNNGVKLSYDDIRKGLEAIIKDKGSENIAAAKRIEMVLDKRLRDGYTDSYGTTYEANENYLNFLEGKDYIDPAEYERQRADEMIAAENADNTLFSLNEEQQKEVTDYINKINEDTTLDDNFKDQILNKFDNLNNYKQFEDIKQEVDDYKDKAYKGISGLTDIVNLTEEDVKQRPMEYTQRKDKNTSNQRKFFDNMETSNIIADETKNRVNATTYEQKSNLDTLEQVRQKLDERGNDMVEEWKHKSKNFTDKDVALGAILVERYQQAGDWNSAARAVEKLADMGTEAGRAVQMYSIFQRLSPETMAIYQQKALNKAFEEMKQKQTGKWVEKNKDKFKLTDEDTKFIYEQVEKASQAIDDETKQRELSKIENRINSKLPPNAGDAIKTLRRISMLFNPKTQVRNIVGNSLIMPINDVADLIGTAIDKVVSMKTGKRTTNTPNLLTKGKGFAKGVRDAITDYKTGTRTTATGSKYEFEFGAKPFNENTGNKARDAINTKLNGLNNLLSAIMSGGDRPFYEAAYNNSLEGQMKANKVSAPTQEMIDIAVNEALQRTWNDSNEYTKTVLGIRKAMNKINIKGFGLGDLIIPFAKTPANLTKAMVEYSPAGFIPSVLDYINMSKAQSRGELTAQQQKRFVNSMSKAIAGTILYVIAGSLARGVKLPWSDEEIKTTGSASDDTDVKNFEQNVLGIQPYSVRLGDKTYTYSWANPLNAPLAIMADSYKMNEENASTFDKLNNALKVAGNVLLDNSFLQGISEIFSNRDGVVSGLVDSVTSMPESLTPTFVSQIASLGDDTQRQTYEYKNKGQTIVNKVKNKIPSLRNTLEPQVNAFGEEIENQNTAFDAFFNPANVREARITDTQKALYDLYNETKDKTIFPDVAPNYTNTGDGEKMNLSNKDKVTYSKASGQYVTDVYGGLFNSGAFDTYHTSTNNNEGKIKILRKVREDANLKGREAIGAISDENSESLSKLNERNKKLEDAGIPYEDYYIMWYYVNNGEDKKVDTKKRGIGEVIRNLDHDISSKQKDVLYGIFDISKGSK